MSCNHVWKRIAVDKRRCPPSLVFSASFFSIYLVETKLLDLLFLNPALEKLCRNLQQHYSNRVTVQQPRQLPRVPQSIGDTLRNDSRPTNHDSRRSSLFSNGRSGLSLTLHSGPNCLILLPDGDTLATWRKLQRRASERPARITRSYTTLVKHTSSCGPPSM